MGAVLPQNFDTIEEPKFLAKLDLKKQTVFMDFNVGGQTLVMLKGLKNGTSISGNCTNCRR